MYVDIVISNIFYLNKHFLFFLFFLSFHSWCSQIWMQQETKYFNNNKNIEQAALFHEINIFQYSVIDALIILKHI